MSQSIDPELRKLLKNIQRRRLRAVKSSDEHFDDVERLIDSDLVQASENGNETADMYTKLRTTRQGMNVLREYGELPFWHRLDWVKWLGLLVAVLGVVVALLKK